MGIFQVRVVNPPPKASDHGSIRSLMDARANRPTLKDRSKEPRSLIWFARILEEATGDVRSKCLLEGRIS
jgi:hypothetical protein